MIIGITGLSGSGKTTLSIYLEKILLKSKVINVDKIHINLLVKNRKWLIDTYGEGIFKNGKLNEELFMSDPLKENKVFELSSSALCETLKNQITTYLKIYNYVILDFFALPKLKEIWDTCNYTILVKSINDNERFKWLKQREEKKSGSPPVDLNLRNAISPNYNLYNFDYCLVNTYDERYYQNIKKIEDDLQAK